MENSMTEDMMSNCDSIEEDGDSQGDIDMEDPVSGVFLGVSVVFVNNIPGKSRDQKLKFSISKIIKFGPWIVRYIMFSSVDATYGRSLILIFPLSNVEFLITWLGWHIINEPAIGVSSAFLGVSGV